MKKSRLLISAFVVLCYMMNFIVLAQSVEQDAAELDVSKYKEAVTVLTGLGLVKGYDDSVLNTNVTRAEIADIIAKMLGLGDVSGIPQDSMAFYDVPSSHWAAGSIAMVTGLDIIHGYDDERFVPEDPVTYEQAIKMLVSALGYGPVAQSRGGYPAGYMSVAAEKRILSGITQGGNNLATKGDVALMVYNSLRVDIAIPTGDRDNIELFYQNETVLSKYMDIDFGKGRIVASSNAEIVFTNLHPKSNEVVIEYVDKSGAVVYSIYKVGSTNANKLLGYEISFYAKINKLTDDKTLLVVMEKEFDNELVLKDESILSVSGVGTDEARLLYMLNPERSSTTRTAAISKDAIVVYNNRLAKIPTNDLLKPRTGEVRLVDTDGNNKYDIVYVTSYKNYVVDGVGPSSKTIMCTGGYRIELGKEEPNFSYSIKLATGQNLKIDDIRKMDVVAVAESTDKLYAEVVVVRNKVTGEVSGIADDEVTIGDQVYEISEEYVGTSITLNSKGDFYLDFSNKIIYFDKAMTTDRKYGYIMKRGMEKGVDKRVMFRMVTQDGEEKIYKCANKVLVNNIPNYDLTSLRVPQLIMYTLNSDEEIKEIFTAQAPGELGYNEEEFSLDFSTSKMWNDGKKYIFGEAPLYYRMDEQTLVFLSYEENGEVKECSLVSHTGALSRRFWTNVEIYDLDKLDVARVIVSTTSSTQTKDIDETAPLQIVDRVVASINSEGETIYKIYAFEAAGYAEYTTVSDPVVSIDPNSVWGNVGVNVKDLKRGDLIEVGFNNNNEVDRFKYLFNSDTSAPYFIKGDARNRAIFGRVLEVIGTYVRINVGQSRTRLFNLGQIPIYLYDRAGDRFITSDIGEVAKGDLIFLHYYDFEPKVLVVYK